MDDTLTDEQNYLAAGFRVEAVEAHKKDNTIKVVRFYSERPISSNIVMPPTHRFLFDEPHYKRICDALETLLHDLCQIIRARVRHDNRTTVQHILGRWDDMKADKKQGRNPQPVPLIPKGKLYKREKPEDKIRYRKDNSNL